MSTSSRAGSELLVDTSVAVALTVSDHQHHQTTFESLADRRLGLALVTRDRRALDVYRTLNVDVELLA